MWIKVVNGSVVGKPFSVFPKIWQRQDGSLILGSIENYSDADKIAAGCYPIEEVNGTFDSSIESRSAPVVAVVPDTKVTYTYSVSPLDADGKGLIKARKKLSFGNSLAENFALKMSARSIALNETNPTKMTMFSDIMPIFNHLQIGILSNASTLLTAKRASYPGYDDIFQFALDQISGFTP